MTQICRIEPKKRKAAADQDAGRTVQRELVRTSDGANAGDLPAVPMELEPGGRVRCQNLLDVIPSSSMADGEYMLRAYVDAQPEGAGEASFEIVTPVVLEASRIGDRGTDPAAG